MAKTVICVWYDGTAEEAARFYAETFPDSAVTAVHHAPGDYPDGKQGQVLTVEFTVVGVACLGLNGGPAFKHSEAFSFQILTEDQAETDRYIAWPAQALAYKLGQLKFRELRERARRELGSQFEIRAFHDEMLNGGVLPLDLLDSRTNGWIQQQKHRSKVAATN